MRLRNPFGRKTQEFPTHLWTQCPSCGEMLFNKQLERNHSVCQKCGHHFKLGALARIELLADPKSFSETDADMVSSDPLGFVDSKPYPERIAAARAKSGHKDAVLTGDAQISGIPVVLAVMDFEFMGGSMGSVVGEKLPKGFQRSEFLLEHGFVDQVVPRTQLKERIAFFLNSFRLAGQDLRWSL